VAEQTEPDFEREKWDAEKALRERELAIRERELALKERGSTRTRWSSPLTISILAAAVAVAGNAFVARYNSRAQLGLEERKVEAARILEIVKVGDPDKAATNLQFLIDTRLIADPKDLDAVKTFLANRKPGQGPVVGPARLAP